MQPKKIISGLDVMKFLMAFLIVDIHVHGSAITPPPDRPKTLIFCCLSLF